MLTATDFLTGILGKEGEMQYETTDGVEFYILPDDAVCELVNKHPDDIDRCPFDGGDVCIPEICIYYQEKF